LHLASLPVGETAAVVAATFWAVSSLLFASVSRRAGPWAVNQFRLFGATILLSLALAAQAWAGNAGGAPPARQTTLLLASGVVGLTLGDGALFRSFYILGARRVSLLTALAPVFVAILAGPVLGERIGLVGLAGMGCTLAGVVWVIADRRDTGDPVRGSVTEGVTLGVLASLGQAAGAVLTKAGLGLAPPDSPLGSWAAAGDAVRPVEPLTAVVLRMSVATAALAIWTVPTGRIREVAALWTDRRTALASSTAMFLGTFCGVWLSLVAFAHTETAVAQTLLSLTPVLVLPIARFATADRPPPRAWIGALVAIVGVALLAFRERLSG
jgi:drug/metabolite transporter (DMT)-like permease